MQLNKLNNLVILCGGTGGHFFPGLTIARQLKKTEEKKCYLIIGGHKDKFASQKNEAEKYGINVCIINSLKLSKNPIKMTIFFIYLFIGFLKARKLLKKIKPDAVLGMGSFTSAPVSFAAISLGIPLFLHDGNARIGKANLFFSRWARITMSAFPAVNKDQLKCEYKPVGMPLRPEIINGTLTKEMAITQINKKFNVHFNNEIPTILIFGGSQGAATINRILPQALNQLQDKIQAIHIIGTIEDKDSIKNQSNVLTIESSNEMNMLYSAADLVISRSGGSTVAELIYFNKSAILIPYPLAPDLHQNDNAEYCKKKINAEIVLNKNCTPEIIKNLIIKILGKNNKSKQTQTETNSAAQILSIIDSKLAK